MGTNFGISRIRMRERKKSRNISVGVGVSRGHVKGEPLVSNDFHGGFLPSDLKLRSQTECPIQRGGAVAVVGRQVIRWLAACCRRRRNPFRRGSAFVGGGRRRATNTN